MLGIKKEMDRITQPIFSDKVMNYKLYYQTEKLYRRVLVFNPTVKVQNGIFKQR